jgi:hypothetical protein
VQSKHHLVWMKDRDSTKEASDLIPPPLASTFLPHCMQGRSPGVVKHRSDQMNESCVTRAEEAEPRTRRLAV